MAKDKYEISLWEDIYVEANETTGAPAHYEEQKLCVIGSDTMTAQCRAIEPKLTPNVNGKNTFTFKMFYIYRDDKTGQMYDNPFLKLLVNERKVKVLWLNKWYDLVIKNIQEASNGKSMIFTCEDANINELAKSGFELTFDDELNTTEFTNQGTAEELAAATVDGTDWAIGNAETIPQYSEEPVFLVTIQDNESIPAVNQLTSETITLGQGDKVLIYYNQLADLYDSVLDPSAGIVSSSTRYLQFAYTEDEFVQDQNNQLVINVACYKTSNTVTVSVTNSSSDTAINGKTIRIAFSGAHTYDLYNLSKQYRAKRLVESTKTVIDQYTGKTCEVYKANEDGSEWSEDDIIYKHVSTVFDEANTTINLAANPSAFTHVKGWDFIRLGAGEWNSATLEFYYDPTIDSSTSYIKLNTTLPNSIYYLYNDCLKSSSQYFTDGVKVGEKYVLRVKICNASGTETPGAYSTLNDFTEFVPRIVTSTTDSNINHKRPLLSTESNYASFFSSPSQGTIESDGWISFILDCTKSFNAADIYSKNIGLFLRIKVATANKKFIEAFEFYKYVEGEDENGNIVRINPGDFDKNAIAQVKYQYYNFTKFDNDYKNGNTTLSKINEYYLYSEVNDWDQVGSTILPVLVPGFAKIRSINIKQSNRFNILQTIAETFQCWIKFRVEHDSTGKIIYDYSDNRWRLQKYIDIVNEIGEDRGLGFIYGIDLQNISRTIESNSIVTKTIVLPNDNEFATEGQCRISRSAQNPPRADYILNFDYYTSHALLDKDQLFNDLYVNTISDENAASLVVEGFYYWLHKWNTEYEDISQEYKEKYMILLENQALYDTYKKVDEAAAQTILDAQEFVKYVVSDEDIRSSDWDDVLDWIITNGHQNDKEIKPHLEAIASQERLRATYGPILEKLQTKIDEYQADIDEITLRMQEIAKLIRLKTLAFYKKYAAFISEGSWTDQKYFDDNLYYLDATSVAYTSSRPKVSYNISVLRLTALEQFKEKDFSLGEIAFVQDTEFFGYSDAARTTPYKEKVLISEITYNFDEPSKDSFKVQNYKTQFEDLFQRIAAATQSLQFNEGIYARAGEVVSSDGTLNMSFLENTFDENGNVLNRTSVNQSVITDATGVTVKSLVDPANVVRITSGGIFITNDGGETWKNAIRGDGISTKYLTAGQIDVGIIQVMDGEHPSFKWDSNGINAYQYDDTGFNYTTFVRMDQYGFYGVAAADSSWVPTNEESIRNLPGAFGATWSGFFANNVSGDHVFATDTSGNLSITGTITAAAGSIGGWQIDDNSLYKDSFIVSGQTIDGAYRVILSSISSNNTDPAFSVASGTISIRPSGTTWTKTEDLFRVNYDGSILATKGSIAGWDIINTQITKAVTYDTGTTWAGNYYRAIINSIAENFYTPSTDYPTGRNPATIDAFAIYTIPSGSSRGSYPFRVRYDGSLVATKAVITGDITATSLTLGTDVSVAASKISGLDSAIDTAVSSKNFYAVGSTISADATAGATSFKVSSDGLLEAHNAVIYGTIYAGAGSFTGTISAGSGQIGGFTISNSSLYNGKSTLTASSTGVYIGTDGISLGTGSTFKVTKAGALTASNLTVTGGTINIGSGAFSVSNTGVVQCSNITATGGKIGGFTIGNSSLYNGKSTLTTNSTGVYIGTDGISLGTGSTFKVTKAGELTASNVNITGGAISIGNSTYGNMTLNSNGLRVTSGSNYTQIRYPYNFEDPSVQAGDFYSCLTFLLNNGLYALGIRELPGTGGAKPVYVVKI